MDELLQGRTLGKQLGQPRLQHHVGQDGQQVVCPAVTTGAISRAGHRDRRPNTCPSLPGLSCTHMAAVARLRPSRVPQYSSAHSQMPRRARTAAQGGRQGRRHPGPPPRAPSAAHRCTPASCGDSSPAPSAAGPARPRRTRGARGRAGRGARPAPCRRGRRAGAAPCCAPGPPRGAAARSCGHGGDGGCQEGGSGSRTPQGGSWYL